MAFNINDLNWLKFEKDKAKDIDSKNLDSGKLQKVSISLMKVRPGGEFSPHTDPYSHFFYVLSGTGEGLHGKKIYKMEKGCGAVIKAGEIHGYKNTGKDDLYLLTTNIL